MKTSLSTKLLYPPAALTLPFAGIDIGNRYIRFFEFAYRPGSISVKKSGMVALPDETISEGDILNKEALIKALAEVKKNLSYDFVKVVIPESKSYIFDVTLPRVARGEIRQALEFRLEENVPFKIEEVYFEYQIINETSANITVSVSVVTKHVVGAFLDIIESAGMHVLSFEIESRMIARSTIALRNHENTIIVCIKGISTIILFAVDGKVRFSSTVSVGERTMRDILMKQDTVSSKHTDSPKDLITSAGEDGSDMLVNVFSILKDEVEKFHQYALSQIEKDAPTASISRLILCGKGSELPGLARHIGQNLDLSVSVANVWTNTLNLEERLPPMTLAESLDFAAVIGAATPSPLTRHA